MDERYTRLFALSEKYYAEGAPRLIAAGALLKDNRTGKVLAQIKFQNISPKTIKAVKVSVWAINYDNKGNMISSEATGLYYEYEYDEHDKISKIYLRNEENDLIGEFIFDYSPIYIRN